MTPILTCPNCERRWSTKDCAARETILCDCGKGIVVPDVRSKAVAAASCATEAANELLAFAREGNQLGSTAFSISVGEKLADAFRLAIDAQGGADDDDEALLYAEAGRYLNPMSAETVKAAAPTCAAALAKGDIRSATDALTHDTLPKVGETFDTQGRARAQVAIADFVERLIQLQAPVIAACTGIADDYMTSESHHPGFVLIPTMKFVAIVDALGGEGQANG